MLLIHALLGVPARKKCKFHDSQGYKVEKKQVLKCVEMQSARPAREDFLDVLRGLAISGVIQVHVSQLATQGGNFFGSVIAEIFTLGKYGVELFFVISGYLLFKLYGRSGERLSNSYYLRRFARIYPLWFIFLLLNIILSLILEHYDYETFLSNFRNYTTGVFVSLILGMLFLLFTSPNLYNDVVPGGWSIQAEVAHYLAFPIFRKYKSFSILNFLIMVNIVTLILVDNKISTQEHFRNIGSASFIIDMWIRLSLFSTIGFFLLGGVLYRWMNCGGPQISLVSINNLPCRIKVSASLYFVTFIFLPLPFGKTYQAICFVMFAVFLGSILNSWGISRKFFSVIGRYSYFIYFVHFFVLDFFKVLINIGSIDNLGLFQLPVAYIFTLLMSFILAIPSMKFIERPVINLFR